MHLNGDTQENKQLETELSGFPITCLQESQPNLWCNIPNWVEHCGSFDILILARKKLRKKVMEVSSADLWKTRQGDKTSYIYHIIVTRRLWLQGTIDQGWPSGSLQPAFSSDSQKKVLLTGQQNNTALEVEAQNWLHARATSNASSAASPLTSMGWLHALSVHQVLLRLSWVSNSSSIHSYHADSELVCFVLELKHWEKKSEEISSTRLSWAGKVLDGATLITQHLSISSEYLGEQCYLKQVKGFLLSSLI